MIALRRLLAARAQAVLYALAGVTYVIAGMREKWLLNWIIGPLWLLAFAWGIPRVTELARAGRERSRRLRDVP